MKKLTVILVVLFMSFLFITFVSAAVPHLIRFQGKVTDKAGVPLSGAYNITFRIYNAELGGALKWSETQQNVPVSNGIFTVLLGSVSALNLPFNEDYWLSMEVSDDGEMVPRQRITSVGYAIHAEVADSIAGVSIIPQGAIILWRGTSCPSGYTRVSEMDGKFLVSGSSYNPSAGGSNTHTHGAGSYTGPLHTHTVPHDGWNPASPVVGSINTNNYGSTASNDQDSGPSGTSPVTGTSAPADSRPAFATILLCQKD